MFSGPLILITIALAALTLGVMSLVGIFHKKTADITEITIAVISGLKPSRKNFLALFGKVFQLRHLWLRKRGLLKRILKRHAFKRLRTRRKTQRKAQREAQKKARLKQQKSPLQ